MFKLSVLVLVMVVSTASIAAARQQLPPSEASSLPSNPANVVVFRVVDEAGEPVKGALLGSTANRSVNNGVIADWHIQFLGEHPASNAATDAAGEFRADERVLFYGEQDTRPKAVIAWSADRATIAIAELTRSDLGKTKVLTLVPACRVTVRSRSDGLKELGRDVDWANVYVHMGQLRPFGCNSFDGTHEFMLPPGEYKVAAYASETDTARTMLTITPGEKERTVELDMPPSRIAQLIGRPAPELAKIKGWKNGDPVTLADLKGKVVLLDFWGHWCGPCVHAMPDLMELHDQHKDHGFVIIAVHDDSVESIAEMDEKLTEIRKSIWKGRDLPFLVALDGGGPTPIPGRDTTTRGATTAAYGVTGFPTQVLIGRDGRFAGLYRPKLLGELLAAPVPR